MMFTLHPQLAADTVVLGKFPLSLALLSKDAHYPWCILVPEKEGISELHCLNTVDRIGVMEESCVLATVMQAIFRADKMNVAALGNVVPQLHIHHIARFHHDAAWPKPVWGAQPAKAYSLQAIAERVDILCQALMEASDFKAL